MLTARCYRLREEMRRSLPRAIRDAMRPARVTVYDPEAIVRLLNQGKVRFVLMGTHGIVGWRSETRATDDIDVLIANRDHAKAVRIIRRAFPQLRAVDVPNVVTRFLEPGIKDPVIDLMRPSAEIYRAVFRHTHAVGTKYRIPDLEMALVCKFAAMTSPTRTIKKKYLDAGDFTDIVEFNREILDIAKLQRLAEKVKPGAGMEIAKLVDDIDAGRIIQIR